MFMLSLRWSQSACGGYMPGMMVSPWDVPAGDGGGAAGRGHAPDFRVVVPCCSTYFHLFSPIFTYFHLFSPIFTTFPRFAIFTLLDSNRSKGKQEGGVQIWRRDRFGWAVRRNKNLRCAGVRWCFTNRDGSVKCCWYWISMNMRETQVIFGSFRWVDQVRAFTRETQFRPFRKSHVARRSESVKLTVQRMYFIQLRFCQMLRFETVSSNRWCATSKSLCWWKISLPQCFAARGCVCGPCCFATKAHRGQG